MKVLSFAVILLCFLVVIDMADCRRKKRRKSKPKPDVPTMAEITTHAQLTTTTLSPTVEPVYAAGACHRVCEGDSHFLKDQCTCGCDKGPGFIYNERIGRCEDIDECKDESNCVNGHCTNAPGSYKCSCPHGYNLHANGNLCLLEPRVLPCRGLICLDEASLDEDVCRCKCNPGLVYDYFLEKCLDIDECAEGLARCQQICVNSEGSYRCQCQDNYRINFDRVSCDPVDPDCKDKAPFCENLASAIECHYSPNMRSSCPKSCRVCVG